MKRQKGFTLIELLVVIGIIGLLATLAVVAFGGAQKQARDSKRSSEIRSVVSAFALAAQAGHSLCLTGCAAAVTADTKVSGLDICDKSCGGGGAAVTGQFVKLANLKDPLPAYVTAGACKSGATVGCDYAIAPLALIDAFTLRFWSELKPEGLPAAGLHSADQNGIVN